jgi:hypothetical protein
MVVGGRFSSTGNWFNQKAGRKSEKMVPGEDPEEDRQTSQYTIGTNKTKMISPTDNQSKIYLFTIEHYAYERK